jgi:hypothetical protein
VASSPPTLGFIGAPPAMDSALSQSGSWRVRARQAAKSLLALEKPGLERPERSSRRQHQQHGGMQRGQQAI